MYSESLLSSDLFMQLANIKNLLIKSEIIICKAFNIWIDKIFFVLLTKDNNESLKNQYFSFRWNMHIRMVLILDLVDFRCHQGLQLYSVIEFDLEVANFIWSFELWVKVAIFSIKNVCVCLKNGGFFKMYSF